MERTAEITGSEIPAAELSEKLSKYWDLLGRKSSLEGRLEKAAEEKASVSDRIYQKVVADYKRELESVSTALEPMQVEVDQLRSACERHRDDVRRVIAELEDQLAEAGFRQRVGEYTDDDVTRVRQELAPLLDEQNVRLADVDRQLAGFDRPQATERPGSEDPVHGAGDAQRAPEMHPERRAHTPQPQATYERRADAPQPQTSYERRADAPETDAWQSHRPHLDVTAPQPPSAPNTPSAAIQTDDDPLAALADPSTRHGSAAASLRRLVFVSGPHAGNAMDLSPEMMSVGREHDNTVELKDPDVARYHARIEQAAGEYYIEDLASSTGTWVNGEPQQRVRLKNGDVVRVGSTEFRFE